MKHKPLILSGISSSTISRYRGKKSYYVVRCSGNHYQILERYERYFSSMEKAQAFKAKLEKKNKVSEFFAPTMRYLYYVSFDWTMSLLLANGKIPGSSDKERWDAMKSICDLPVFSESAA